MVIWDNPNGDSYEPDNTAPQAKHITNGQTQTHSIVPREDIDWIYFDLGNSSEVTLETAGASAILSMQLYESDGVTPRGASQSNTIRYSLDAGRYYLRISGWNNATEIASYTLKLTVEDPVDISVEVYLFP